MGVESSVVAPDGTLVQQRDRGGRMVPGDLEVGDPAQALDAGQQALLDGQLDSRKAAEGAVAAGGSGDPARRDRETSLSPEMRKIEVESAAFTIIKAEAVRAYRQGLKEDIANPTEMALGRLGRYLSSPTVNTPHTGEPLLITTVKGEYRGGVLESNHPLPRLKQSDEPGQWVTSYDRRATDEDTEPSAIGTGVVQLDTFTGKTPDGVYHFLGTTANGAHSSEIVLSENDFVKAFMLAQTTELQKGLGSDAKPPSEKSGLRKQSVRGMIGQVVGACEEFATNFDESTSDGFDLVGGIDEKAVKEALKEGNASISREAGLSLAQSMIEYNRKNLNGLSEQQIASIEKTLLNTQAEIEAGIQPSAEQLYKILALVGEPGLRSQLSDVSRDIQVIESRLNDKNLPEQEKLALEVELKKKKGEVKSIQNVLNKKKDNEVFRLLEEAQNGKMDPDLVGLLNGKIAEVTDPKGFFEIATEDLEDPNSLGSIIARHFAIKHGIDDVKMKAWLTKFFQEHGSDIAMMGIFALFQMMSGIIGDAARKA